MKTYKIITNPSEIASTDPLNFTGAVIGVQLRDGFRIGAGHVVELVEDGFHVLDSCSYRRSYRQHTACVWGNGTSTEIMVYALVSGPIGEEIDAWVSHARELLRHIA